MVSENFHFHFHFFYLLLLLTHTIIVIISKVAIFPSIPFFPTLMEKNKLGLLRKIYAKIKFMKTLFRKT